MASLLETLMLVCFGCSWPMALMKNLKAKTTKGTSLLFLILIILGYIAGISAKIVSGNINYVLIVYILNLAIVSANLLVYFHNSRMEKKEQLNL